jgi:transposase
MTPTRVVMYLAVGRIDLRGSFGRLASVVRQVLQQDPMSGAVFLFVNRAGNRIKVLWWDRNGYVILYKRLSRGSFFLPDVNPMTPYVSISGQQLAQIIAGLPVVSKEPVGLSQLN